MLLDAGADVDARDNGGMTPLMWAAKNGTADRVKFLLDAGADADAQDTYGRTSSDLANNIRYLGRSEIEDYVDYVAIR